ncbi:MAG: DUF2752 domain-containing protein [Lachnospiraceae bacterium]|nr:DUF2752 domain-containing protein [Lachnospiraceae bacterium]
MKLKDFVYVSCIITVLYFILHLLGIGCPIRFFTGISCPGCGMTRSWIALLHCNIADAFRYHPLFLLPPIWVIFYFFQQNRGAHIITLFRLFCGCSLGLFILVYLLRLFNPADSIVTFEPHKGLLYQIIHFFMEGIKHG